MLHLDRNLADIIICENGIPKRWVYVVRQFQTSLVGLIENSRSLVQPLEEATLDERGLNIKVSGVNPSLYTQYTFKGEMQLSTTTTGMEEHYVDDEHMPHQDVKVTMTIQDKGLFIIG